MSCGRLGPVSSAPKVGACWVGQPGFQFALSKAVACGDLLLFEAFWQEVAVSPEELPLREGRLELAGPGAPLHFASLRCSQGNLAAGALV